MIKKNVFIVIVALLLDSILSFQGSKVQTANLRPKIVYNGQSIPPCSSQTLTDSCTSYTRLFIKKDMESEDDVIDFEYDFLNLDNPLTSSSTDSSKDKKDKKTLMSSQEEDENKLIVAYNDMRISPEMIIDESTGEQTRKPPRKALLKKTAKYDKDHKRNWPNWDEFMEKEFGDLDAPLNDDQDWMYVDHIIITVIPF
jgi:hypothetical protein